LPGGRGLTTSETKRVMANNCREKGGKEGNTPKNNLFLEGTEDTKGTGLQKKNRASHYEKNTYLPKGGRALEKGRDGLPRTRREKGSGDLLREAEKSF